MKAELYTVNALALLTKLDRRTVGKRLENIIPAKSVGSARKYSLASALPALCHAERDEAAERMATNRETLQVIDIQEKEVSQLARLHKLALLDDCTAYVQEERIAFRQIIAHAEFLNDSQKKRILEKCKAVKISKPEPIEA